MNHQAWKSGFKPLGQGRPKRQPGTVAQRHVIARGEEQLLHPRATGHTAGAGHRSAALLRSQAQAQHLTGIEVFLQQPATADLAQNSAIRHAAAGLSLQVYDAVTMQTFTLNTDADAIEVAPDVLAGLRGAPAAEQSGVTAAELSAHDQQRAGLAALDKTVEWMVDQVQTGKSILKTWQSQAQKAIATALWAEIQAAPTAVARMAIVQDASEVFDFETKQLQRALANQQKQAAKLGALQAQVAASGQEVQFLQTLQDLRDGKPVPDAVLAEMAQYYAERGNTAPSFTPPETRRGTSRGAG